MTKALPMPKTTTTEVTATLPRQVADWMLGRYRDEVGEVVPDHDLAQLVADRETVIALRDQSVAKLLPKRKAEQDRAAKVEAELRDIRSGIATIDRDIASAHHRAEGSVRRIDAKLREATRDIIDPLRTWARATGNETRRQPINSRVDHGARAGFAGLLFPEKTWSEGASVRRRLAHLLDCERACDDVLPYLGSRQAIRDRIEQMKANTPDIRMEVVS